MADIAGEPHVRDHARAVRIAERDRFPRGNLQIGVEFFSFLAACAAVVRTGRVFRRKGKGLSFLHGKHV